MTAIAATPLKPSSKSNLVDFMALIVADRHYRALSVGWKKCDPDAEKYPFEVLLRENIKK
jgi:hypothetical protein